MSIVTNSNSSAWTTVHTTTTETLYSVESGTIRLNSQGGLPESLTDGFIMKPGDKIVLTSNQEVKMIFVPSGTTSEAVIVFMEI